VFFILAFVLLFVLPSPWEIVAFVVCLGLFVGELLGWNRTVRARRAQTGADTLIGRSAKVVTACHPDGQVRLEGEIWKARCAAGAEPGDDVLVTGRQRLLLIVEPKQG
jgi:membrane-bound serine protease (ClpP class)